MVRRRLLYFLIIFALIVSVAGCGVAEVGESVHDTSVTEEPGNSLLMTPEDVANLEITEEEDPREDTENKDVGEEEDKRIPEKVTFQTCTQEWETSNGYKLECTYALSPWIKYDSPLLADAWKQTGAISAFPDFSDSRTLYNIVVGQDCNGKIVGDVAYAVGYYEVVNKTPGFDISTTNPIDLNMVLLSNNYIRTLLYVEQDGSNGRKYTAIVGDKNDCVFENCGGSDDGLPVVRLTNNSTRAYFVIAVGVSDVSPNTPDGIPNPAEIIISVPEYPVPIRGVKVYHSFDSKVSW